MKFADMTDDSIRTMVEYARDRETQIQSIAETTGRSADEIRAVADGEEDYDEPKAAEIPKPGAIRSAKFKPEPPEETKAEPPKPPKEKKPRDWSAHDWTRLDPVIAAGLADGKAVYDIATGLGMPDSTLYHHVKKYPERFPHIVKQAKPSWPMPGEKRSPKPAPKPEPEPEQVPAPTPEPLTSNEERDMFLDQLRAILSVVGWRAISVYIDTEDCRIEIMKTRRDLP